MGTTTTARSSIAREAETSYTQTIIGLLLAMAYVLLPDVAWATSNSSTISSSLTKFGDNIGPLPYFVSFLAYVSGIASIAVGLINAKNYTEKPDSLMKIIGPLIIGGLLIAFPATWSMVTKSLVTSAATANTEGQLYARTGAAGTIGGAITTFGKATFGGGKHGLFDLVDYFCYVVGMILMFSGLRGAYSTSLGAQGAPKPSGIVWRLIGAALLTLLPYIVQLVRTSMFTDPSAKHNFAAAGTAVAGAGLDAALSKLVVNVKDPMIDITFMVCFLIGIILIAQTLYNMSGINYEQQKVTPGQMVGRLIIGGILVSGWSITTAVQMSIFGQFNNGTTVVAASSLAYVPPNVNADRIAAVLSAVLTWIQIIGVIAFFRGWISLKASLDGGNVTKSQGITQVIAGALCINMKATLEMIGATIGVSII